MLNLRYHLEPDLLVQTMNLQTRKKILSDGELNPGLPRDRLGVDTYHYTI